MTFGAIVFLMLAVGAVVAFPLVMSTFGLKDFTATTTWLIRWPLLFALMMGTLTLFYRFGPSREGGRRGWFSPGAAIAALYGSRARRRCPFIFRISPTIMPPMARSARPSA